jgi:nucleotide-binding universal stress UspA family protein
MKIRFYYTDEEEEYVEELSALAKEMMTEGASEAHAYLRAAGMIDELLEYAKNWDDDVVKKKEGARCDAGI